MKRTFRIDALTGDGIDEAISGVEEYRRWLKERTSVFVQRLAEYGVTVAKAIFSTARYDGDNDVSVSLEQRGDVTCVVVATGAATLFLEFGSGITLGYGHPEAGKYGMGPGTYPEGKGHWDDPRGWYLPKEKGGGHTYGNPPSGAMYSARKEIELEFTRIAREVFGSD